MLVRKQKGGLYILKPNIFKRLLLLTCLLFVSLVITSCSGEQAENEGDTDTVSSTVSSERTDEIEEETLEETAEETEPLPTLPIYDTVTSFSNGVALVEVRDLADVLKTSPDETANTQSTYALIDTAGNVKLVFSAADWDEFYMYDDVLCLGKDGSLYFYDAEGNIAFQFETTEEIKRYAVQGYGDGHWLVLREESGFSSSEVYLFSVDKEGNISEKEYDITDLADPAGAGTVQYYFTCDYYGDGIFLRAQNESTDPTHIYYMYDAHTGSLYYSGYLGLYAEFYNGVTLGRFTGSNDDREYNNEFGAFAVTSEQLREWLTVEYAGAVEDTQCFEANAQVKSVVASGIESSGAYKVPYSESYEAFDIGSGILMVENNEDTIYYDFINGKTISLPVYEGDVRVESTGAFSGEYAKLVLCGADGNYYLTIINRQGKPMYEPVMAEGADKLYGSSNWNGYILDSENGRYWTPDGELHEDDKFLNISEDLYWDTSILEWDIHVAYSGGYGFYKDDTENISIESWDGSEEISEISFSTDTVCVGSVNMVSAH